MTVAGSPQLTLETGATDAVVDYASGSGTNTLTFSYTVANGHAAPDLDYVSTAALTLNGGSIADGPGNAATLTLAAPGAAGSLGFSKDLVVDTIAPAVTDVTSSTADGTYGPGASVAVQVTFSKPVTVTGTPQLTLETGPADAVVDYASGSGTTTLTFTYMVVAGHTSPDFDYVATTSWPSTPEPSATRAATSRLWRCRRLAPPARSASTRPSSSIPLRRPSPTSPRRRPTAPPARAPRFRLRCCSASR